jgi:hypothetical protein
MLGTIDFKFGGNCMARFYFTGSLTSDKDKSLRGYIELLLPPELGGIIHRSYETVIYVSDWYNLCAGLV